jgi:hypothetical protein
MPLPEGSVKEKTPAGTLSAIAISAGWSDI